MLALIIKLLIMTVAVFGAARILPGVKIEKPLDAIFVALGLGLVNALISPILALLGFLNIITFGIFSLLMNGVIILIVDSFLKSFKVNSFIDAILMAIVLSLISNGLYWLLGILGLG